MGNAGSLPVGPLLIGAFFRVEQYFRITRAGAAAAAAASAAAAAGFLIDDDLKRCIWRHLVVKLQSADVIVFQKTSFEVGGFDSPCEVDVVP